MADLLVLHGGLDLGAPAAAAPASPDLIAMLLASQRSSATRTAYQLDLGDFFGDRGSSSDVRAFVGLPKGELYAHLLGYKSRLLKRDLSPATINRRLSSVCALLRLAHRLELCVTDGRGLVDREKVKGFRDVRGVGVEAARRLLQLPDLATIGGVRDRAILGIALELGLRNSEICGLDVPDLAAGRLRVVGKGSGGQAVRLDVPPALISDIRAYLDLAGHSSGPLFVGLNTTAGGRLTRSGLRWIVQQYEQALGEHLTVHKLRHSAITAAASTTGSLFDLADYSRHAQVATLQHYVDDRSGQARISQLVSDLLRGAKES